MRYKIRHITGIMIEWIKCEGLLNSLSECIKKICNLVWPWGSIFSLMSGQTQKIDLGQGDKNITLLEKLLFRTTNTLYNVPFYTYNIRIVKNISSILSSCFYPRPVLAFVHCRCLRLSVCVSVCVCINHVLVRAITHHPFKLGSPNLDQRCLDLD